MALVSRGFIIPNKKTAIIKNSTMLLENVNNN